MVERLVKKMEGFGYEILTDFSKTGRERPWLSHKTNSALLSESFSRLGKGNKADSVCNCGSHLRFNVCPEGHEKRLAWANFCRVRLCPMCGWRRSLLVAHQLKVVAHEAVQRRPMRWLFLTLTLKNCDPDDLEDTITHLMKSWDRFIRRKTLKKFVIGWFRAFEVTRNGNDGLYHPHFHVLLGVPPSYFRSKDYMNTNQIAELWQDCLRVDYLPIVDIRIVKNKRNVEKEMHLLEEKGIEISDDGTFSETQLSGSAVAELAKYSTKAEDYLIYNKYDIRNVDKKGKLKLVPDYKSGIDEQKTDFAVSLMDGTLSHRRLYAFGGLLKEVWEEEKAKGKIEDAEDDTANLVHADENTLCKCSVCASNMLEELYSWVPSVKQYIKKEND